MIYLTVYRISTGEWEKQGKPFDETDTSYQERIRIAKENKDLVFIESETEAEAQALTQADIDAAIVAKETQDFDLDEVPRGVKLAFRKVLKYMRENSMTGIPNDQTFGNEVKNGVL